MFRLYSYFRFDHAYMLLTFAHQSFVTAYALLRLQYFVTDWCLLDFISVVMGLMVPVSNNSNVTPLYSLIGLDLYVYTTIRFSWNELDIDYNGPQPFRCRS